MSAPKDMMGREIKAGDIIAYGLMVGRSANLAVYKVNEVVVAGYRDWNYGNHPQKEGDPIFKLKASKLSQTYGGEQEKPSTLAFLARALVINESAAAWA